MQHYFDQWSYAHPYPEDFRHSIIDFTGVDLNWFFDRGLKQTRASITAFHLKKNRRTTPIPLR